MKYTLEDYIESVVEPTKHKLDGWPDWLKFTNLSNLPGGQATLNRLTELWDNGTLAFVPVTDAELQMARVSPERLAPAPVCERRQPHSGRDDLGKARRRYKTNPPRRHPKNGPKTKKWVEDSDAEAEGGSKAEARCRARRLYGVGKA